MESRNPALEAPSDDAVARYVKQTGMATDEQVQAARKLAPLPLAEALVQNGVITPLQREAVEKKVEVARVGELAGCKLLRKLGEGGMGAVYLAEDAARSRKVAIKVLPKKNAADPEFLKRFRREAEAAVKLDHPNIVRAFSAGEDKGYHFYLMEYCEGESLKKRIDHQKFLPHVEAAEIVHQIAGALQYAHGLGFIHRDIKPENIMVTPSGSARILDLGLTKNLGDSSDSLHTVTGAALGTPHYISPEQARGDKSVDGRTDIYSLGATFYHAITGRTPFSGSSIFEVIQKHLMEQLVDPRDVRPEIPAAVVEVVRKMMAKNPDDRYRDCAGAITDLERIRQQQPPVARSIDPALSSIAGPTVVRPSLLKTLRDPRRRLLLASGAAGVVLLVIAIAILAWPNAQPPPAPPDPRPPVARRVEPKVAPKVDPKVEPPKVEPDPPKPPPTPPPTPPPDRPAPARWTAADDAKVFGSDERHGQNKDVPGSKWIELLPTIDVKRHSANLDDPWERTADGIVSPVSGVNGNPSRIWIPYSPPELYELIIYVERLEGNEDLVLGFVSKGQMFAVAVDGWFQNGFSGAFLPPRGWTENRQAPQHVISAQGPTRISCFVNGGGFSLRINGNAQLAYPDRNGLGMPENLKCFPGQTDGFVLGSVRSRIKITSVALLPIRGGTGQPIR